MTEDIHHELAAEYALARRLNPLADPERLADWIMTRLSDDQRLTLAGEALIFAEDPGDRQALARAAVLNFVLAMEGE